MPRLEDVLAVLAAVPGVRAAALGGFDGLLVDEAYPVEVAAEGVEAGPDVPAAADAGAVLPADLGGVAVPELLSRDVSHDLGGAVVELTHAWHAVRRACAEHLEAGETREVIVVAEGGVALAHAVGARWFAFVWADGGVDLAVARAALQRSAAELARVVA